MALTNEMLALKQVGLIEADTQAIPRGAYDCPLQAEIRLGLRFFDRKVLTQFAVIMDTSC